MNNNFDDGDGDDFGGEDSFLDLLPNEYTIDQIKQNKLPKLIEPSGVDTIKTKVSTNSNEDLESDFDKARKKIYDTIEIASEAIDEMRDLAQMSGHPKAYEVLNQYIKSLSKISRDLVELHKLKAETEKQKQDLTPSDEDGKDKKSSTTNNLIVFGGTTAELQKLINQVKDDKK